LYNMLPAEAGDASEGRTAAANATVRTVFIIGPENEIKQIYAVTLRGCAPGVLDRMGRCRGLGFGTAADETTNRNSG
jgi:alkyl hydroperoxide reductase subunit AhpC